MPHPRKVGRPIRLKPLRSRRPVQRVNKRRGRRPAPQAGGQLGALLPLVKFLGPLLLGEAAKFGIQTGIRKVRKRKKKRKGGGLHLAGTGLKLAGQGGGRRGPRRKMKRRPKMQVIIPGGIKVPLVF